MSVIGANPYGTLGAIPTRQAVETTAKASENPVAEGVSSFRSALEAADQSAIETAVSGADPHALVEALANAELALEAAVTVRDKVVEAYQELLRMPV